MYTDTVKQLFSNGVNTLEDVHDQTEKVIDITPATTLEPSSSEHIQIMAQDAIADPTPFTMPTMTKIQ